jgi:hypothetical protein
MNCYMSFAMRKTFTGAALVLALLGCGGSLNGNKGPDGSTTAPCSSLGECDCYAASGRCAPRTEACWCPSQCAPIECICGGGRFLGCEDSSPPPPPLRR